MRRVFVAGAFVLLLVCVPALAQEAPARHETPSQQVAGEEERLIWWKWANFALLAIGLGYLASKSAPAFFRARSEQIAGGISEGARLKAEAEARVADIEKRLANIEAEIDRLRGEAKSAVASEAERIRKQTEEHLEKIGRQTRQEVELIARGSRQQLRAHAAQLAIDLAGRRVQSGMTPEKQSELVHNFADDLETGKHQRAYAH